MLSQECRPQVFADVAGQTSVKELLKAIVKNPDNAPRTLILQGEFGTGKTTCARILSKALNCLNKTKEGDACGQCNVCKNNVENSIFYEEFDSAMVGNVNDIKELKNTFYFDKSLGYKVIVLDEAQLMTPQAQSTLLKVFEESTSGVFFLLCTTHIEKILPTIQSRSLKLRFDLVSDEELRLNLQKIITSKNIEITEDCISLIIDRCQGHVRDAHLLLDEYMLLGEEQFKKIIQSSKELYYKLIIAVLRGDMKAVKSIITALLYFPLSTLKRDYEQAVLDIVKVGLGAMTSDSPFLNAIVKSFNNKIFVLIDVLNDKKIFEMFTSDKRFQTAMYLLVSNISQIQK